MSNQNNVNSYGQKIYICGLCNGTALIDYTAVFKGETKVHDGPALEYHGSEYQKAIDRWLFECNKAREKNIELPEIPYHVKRYAAFCPECRRKDTTSNQKKDVSNEND